MDPYNKRVNIKDIENSRKLQKLLAINGIEKGNDSSRALSRSEMLRLFRITPAEDKLKGYFDAEEFMNSPI